MYQWHKKAVTALCSTLLLGGLVACDSSSSDDEEPTPAPTPSPTMSPTPGNSPSPEPTVSPSPVTSEPSRELKTTDLLVPEGTDFAHATSYNVEVKVDKSDVSTGKAFISICSDFEMVNSVQIRANYDDCQVRANFEGGVFEKNITLDHTDHELAVSVIFLEDGQTPYVEMFNGLGPDNNSVVMD